MEILTLGLLLIAAVLISSVIDQLVPRVSLPLVQIGMGLLIAVLAQQTIKIELNPDLFLVLFIAPLLYDEAKNANKADLWHDRKPILSLAIGLVVATTLIIGFVLNAVVPSIPLAAAFALGAALGPTDAVAVSSLAKVVHIPKRQESILQGELLLNDASGIVAFQFAIAAAVTGTFSLFDAGTTFAVEFFGGLLFGAIFGVGANWLVRKVRSIGIENTTFHVLFEVLTPFIVYLAATACHVSGIIAVVVAGLVNVVSPRTIGPSVSRMNIVSSSVWHVLTFGLNGIVFVLLGTQLPGAMYHTWDDVSISNLTLVGYVAGLTVLLLGIRFIWCLIMEYCFVTRKQKRTFHRADAKTALITTLCGAKGTITLSILFTIPIYLSSGVRFPQRDLIIFLACGVIVCTLLIATFVVPLLAPRQDPAEEEQKIKEREVACNIEILRNVIEELNRRRTKENRRETARIIKAYSDRIAHVKEANDISDESDAARTELRIEAIGWEKQRALELLEAGETSGMTAYRYLARLERMEDLLKHQEGRFAPQRFFLRLKASFRRGLWGVLHELPGTNLSERDAAIRELQIKTEAYAIGKLEELVNSTEVRTEVAAALLIEYQANLALLRNTAPTFTTTLRLADQTNEIKRFAYQYELEQIQQMYEEGRLCRTSAKRLRENVILMQLDLEDNI